MPLSERGDDDPQQVNLPDAHPVEPDDGLAVGVRHPCAEEFRREVTTVPSGADGAESEPGREQREQTEIEEVEEEGHQA